MVGLIHFVNLSTSTSLQRALVDLGHVPIFAFIAYVLLKFMHSSRPETTEFPELRDYLYAGLAVLLLAVISEATQINSPGRSASVADIFRDCTGGALTLLISAAYLRSPASKEQFKLRTPYLVVASALLAVLLAPTAWVTAALMNRSANWPTIVGSNYRLERVFAVAYQSNMRIIAVPSEWRVDNREHAFHVQLATSQDSGVLLQELERDWGKFNQACFEITNPDSRPLQTLLKFGNHPMFFRSAHFSEAPLSIDGGTRAIRCVSLEHLARYQSLALITFDTNEVPVFLLHRIWLQ